MVYVPDEKWWFEGFFPISGQNHVQHRKTCYKQGIVDCLIAMLDLYIACL